MVEIALVDSFSADLTVHVLKVVYLLHFVFNIHTLLATQDIKVCDLVNFLLALRARVFHLFDPLLNAREAVYMGARV